MSGMSWADEMEGDEFLDPDEEGIPMPSDEGWVTTVKKPSISTAKRQAEDQRRKELEKVISSLCSTIEKMDARSIGLALQNLVKQNLVEAKTPYRLVRESDAFAVQYAIMGTYHKHQMTRIELESAICSIYAKFSHRIYGGIDTVVAGCLSARTRPNRPPPRIIPLVELEEGKKKVEESFGKLSAMLNPRPDIGDLYRQAILFGAPESK